MSAILASGLAGASPLGIQPTLAAAADYESNPDMRAGDPRPETIGALIVDAPLTYDMDGFEAGLTTNARFSTSKGYSSLGSNFLHLNAFGQYTTDRDSLSVTASVDRDTSLAHGGESDNGIGVRTDSLAAVVDWQHSLTERAHVEVGGSWQRARYDQAADQVGLLDYHYINANSNVGYSVTERTTLKILGSASRYTSDNELITSRSYDLQLGFERQVTELWTLSASLGYARSQNSEKQYIDFFGFPLYLGTVDAAQKGAVYAASATRHSEKSSLSVSASRAYLPSGFGLLSRQDSVGLQGFYNHSERWSFGAQVGYHTTGYPLANSSYSPVQYFSGDLSASWNWTPVWKITLHTSWVEDRYQSAPNNPQSRGVSLQFTRQFYRIDL